MLPENFVYALQEAATANACYKLLFKPPTIVRCPFASCSVRLGSLRHLQISKSCFTVDNSGGKGYTN